MAYTYFFIFAAMRKLKSDIGSLDKEYASALTETLANPAHLTSFILVLFFWISWLPFLLITFLEYLAQWKIQVVISKSLNIFHKRFIYVGNFFFVLSPRFNSSILPCFGWACVIPSGSSLSIWPSTRTSASSCGYSVCPFVVGQKIG